MRTVAVVFGGKSSEREISIVTGVFVLNLLDEKLYEGVPIYIDEKGDWYSSSSMRDLSYFKEDKKRESERVVLIKGWLCRYKKGKTKRIKKIDAVINACHGGWGEGGGVSAFIEEQGLDFASPDISTSAIFIDKYLTKLFCKGIGVPTLDYCKVCEEDYRKRSVFFIKGLIRKLGFPMVVKPSRGGSSIGIVKVSTEEELKTGLESAFLLDDKLIVERFLEGKRDINCGAYLKKGEVVVSEPEEASSGAEIYSFQDKYLRQKKKAPSPVEESVAKKIRTYTRSIYKKTGTRGVVRMDFLVAGEEVYLGEVNTVPGSLAYYLFCERLSDAKQFFSDLLEEGGRKQEKQILETGALKRVKTVGKSGAFRL